MRGEKHQLQSWLSLKPGPSSLLLQLHPDKQPPSQSLSSLKLQALVRLACHNVKWKDSWKRG